MTQHIGLRFDWTDVLDEHITAILGLGARAMNNGSANWDAVAICIGEIAVMLTVEVDTAEVIVAREPAPSGTEWQSIPSFDFAVGKRLGWSWIGTNSQGYSDSFTLGLDPDFIDPRCTFVTDGGNGLYCYDLVPRHA